jgi:hypothetical protein
VSYGRFLALWTIFGCGENNVFRGVQCGFLNPPTGLAQNPYDQTSMSIIGLNCNPAVSDQRASFSVSRTCILFNLGPERALTTLWAILVEMRHLS